MNVLTFLEASDPIFRGVSAPLHRRHRSRATHRLLGRLLTEKKNDDDDDDNNMAV